MAFLSRLRSMFSDAPASLESVEPAPDIELLDDGFASGTRLVRWSAVTRVTTYKIDLVTIDCICLRFDLDDDPPLELTEESNGFNVFMDVLVEQFPTMPPDWYATVMQPPFERNEAVLFDRRLACGGQDER